ncbi:MAG TPA: hypothetical protein VNM47_02250 [Terriglobia bacterium]|nr:hypothetical protein [Terriglobia bacterium]
MFEIKPKFAKIFNAVSIVFITVLVAIAPLRASQFDPDMYAGMQWRLVGPFRAGRVSAVAGVIGRPGVYYMASPGGGVWKTTDAGVVWKPIFDQAHVASIGALAVATSNGNIIYVGTGDFGIASTAWGAANLGNGVWRSDDGGRTWRHIGLTDTAHIGSILVDPKNPDVALVAALGNAYGPDPHRGVFLTSDGGRTWSKTLYKVDTTGAISLTYDAALPGVVYASLWHHHAALPPAPADNDQAGGAIYKSTDGGRTWHAITGNGLPTWPMGRIGLAADDGRVFANIARAQGHIEHLQGGFFRSDDGGATWRRITIDPRLTPGGRSGFFNNVWIDPQNRDVVYVNHTAFYRSVDGGKTFEVLKSSPGGDDYHNLWIDPHSQCLPLGGGKGCRSSQMILGADQGVSVSLNGGETWSSWYNQPTGQMYHVATDNRFPFHIYGPQQDNGSVEVSSRGAFGDINFMNWRVSMGACEYGRVLPDPAHPQWIFSSQCGPGINRRVRGTWQTLDVTPYLGEGGPYRYAFGPWWGSEEPPLVFSPRDGNIFYDGAQYLLETTDGGRHWRRISPDLTHRDDLPVRPLPHGKTSRDWAAISAIGPSPLKDGLIWVGTDDGLVQVTRDGGKTWQRATIPELKPLDTISMIEASPFNAGEAYVVMDRHDWGDFRPYIYRTEDFGRTWSAITLGIPNEDFVRVVRADPKSQGLLYAGTENGAFVSFNDGKEWQSLQLNLPTASVRDLAIRDGDLVAATYGRAFWILDDLSPLRQLNAQVAAAPAHLFRPADAYRVRRDTNSDTALPPEEPAGTNPPAGAILDYTLRAVPSQVINLAIYDANGKLVRQYSSAPIPESVRRPLKWPTVADYWMANPQPLPTHVGMNRFVWDLRYTPPPAVKHGYPMSAIPHATPAGPEGPLVVPGKYLVNLTVDGETYTQPLTVRRDPRGTATPSDFAAQIALEQKLMAGMRESFQAWQKAEQQGDSTAAGKFADLNGTLSGLADTIEGADAAPTPAMYDAVRREMDQLAAQLGRN